MPDVTALAIEQIRAARLAHEAWQAWQLAQEAAWEADRSYRRACRDRGPLVEVDQPALFDLDGEAVTVEDGP